MRQARGLREAGASCGADWVVVVLAVEEPGDPHHELLMAVAIQVAYCGCGQDVCIQAQPPVLCKSRVSLQGIRALEPYALLVVSRIPVIRT